MTGFEATIECGAAALAQSESRKPIWMRMPHGGYGRGSRANGRMSDGYKAHFQILRRCSPPLLNPPGTHSSACPGKSSLSEPETRLIGHDQRDSTLPKRLDRFIAVAHSAIGARTTTVTPRGIPIHIGFPLGLGECGCAALDRCFEPSHRFSLRA